MNKSYYIYILSSTNHSIFYTGVTNDLLRRTYGHKNKVVPGYTSKYNLNKLLYYEEYLDPENAIAREKQVKKYSQVKKIKLIQKFNPGMIDLYDGIINL